MKSASHVQILDKAVCILFGDNVFWKGKNFSSFGGCMVRMAEQRGLFTVATAIGLIERKLWMKISYI